MTVLRYDLMVENALRGVLREALTASRSGLPGEHHFYITFRTRHPGVSISERLRTDYPQEMTVVLQHQFWDLDVDPDGFAVSLSFNQVSERLRIPFAAVTAFSDPSAKFGLQFPTTGTEEPEDAAPAAEEEEAESLPPEEGGARVIALDSFRKK